MEKPGKWFAIWKMWEKHSKKKEILKKEPASLLEISLWDSFQFCANQPPFSSLVEHPVLMGYFKQLMA